MSEFVECKCGASYSVWYDQNDNPQIDDGKGGSIDYCLECFEELPLPERPLYL